MTAGKPGDLRLRVGGKGGGDGVVRVQNRSVGRGLVPNEVLFSVDVFLHIGMPVQVIRGHVCNHRHAGSLFHSGELETGQLHDGGVLGADVPDAGKQGAADIAAEIHGSAGGGQQAGDSANSAESAVEGKVCPHCGEKNPEFAEFCSR